MVIRGFTSTVATLKGNCGQFFGKGVFSLDFGIVRYYFTYTLYLSAWVGILSQGRRFAFRLKLQSIAMTIRTYTVQVILRWIRNKVWKEILLLPDQEVAFFSSVPDPQDANIKDTNNLLLLWYNWSTRTNLTSLLPSTSKLWAHILLRMDELWRLTTLVVVANDLLLSCLIRTLNHV